jgi:hypothetical protein
MTRLMCSKDRKEVESVQEQLLQRAGIRSHIRKNQLAEAFGVPRLELWLELESDFAQASRIYAGINTQSTEVLPPAAGSAPPPKTPQSRLNTGGVRTATAVTNVLDVEEVRELARMEAAKAADLAPKEPADLVQASSLLESEIEDLLAREARLTEKCLSLETRVLELTQALAASQEQLTASVAARATDQESVVELAQKQEPLQGEIQQLRARLQSREEALVAAQELIERLQQELRGYVGNLNFLRGRLHAKNAPAGPLPGPGV